MKGQRFFADIDSGHILWHIQRKYKDREPICFRSCSPDTRYCHRPTAAPECAVSK